MAFFIYFIWKWVETFEKLQLFTFGPKQCFYLTYSAKAAGVAQRVNMIIWINESKALAKHTSCECKCKFEGRKCNSDQWWNNGKRWCEFKKHVCEKDFIWNLATCSCKNRKYFASIMDHSAITCNKIIESYHEETKSISINFNEKKATCKSQHFYILLTFLLITIVFLIAFSIYCYLIKYRSKQKSFITISRYK